MFSVVDFAQAFAEFGGGKGGAEVMTLNAVAAALDQVVELLLGFHAFGDDLDVEVGGPWR